MKTLFDLREKTDCKIYESIKDLFDEPTCYFSRHSVHFKPEHGQSAAGNLDYSLLAHPVFFNQVFIQKGKNTGNTADGQGRKS